MSRTWGLATVGPIKDLSEGLTTVLANVVASVEKLWLHAEGKNGCITLGTYPNWVGAPLVMGRKLALSLEEAPELDFPHKHMGTIELLGHKEVHLLLEDVR